MNNSNNSSTKYEKLLNILIIFSFAFIIVFAICGMAVSPKMEMFSEMAYVYDEEWVKHNSDGSTENFVMPTSLELEDDDYVTLTTVLPDYIVTGTYLAINTGKSFTAYVDDEEIYSFDNTISRIPGHITKTIISPIPLNDSYAGKELELVITNGKYDRTTVHTAYIGSLMGIAMTNLKNQSLQVVLAFLISIAAFITICIFLYIQKRDGSKVPLVFLAAGMLAISMWIIVNSNLFQLLFDLYFFDGIVGFMLVITMCLPFFLYFDDITGKRFHKIYIVAESVIIVNFVVLTFLHMTDMLSYDKSLVYIDLLLLVYIGIIVTCTLDDHLKRKDGEHRYVLIGVIGLGAFGALEVAVTILNARSPFKMDIGGISVLIGMMFLLFFAILDQVKAMKQLKEETQNAIAATKAKSDFLARMSHEIRTPINAIMGMNEMILRDSDQDKIKDYAKDIDRASDNLLRLINDILDFSKIESGKIELVNDNYNFGELIYDTIVLVNMKAEDKGLKLNVSIDENMPCMLYGDDKRVREIITNILNNAVKYTDNGFVNLSINGHDDDEHKNVVLNIKVEDSGQGIKEEDLGKIFNSFARVDIRKNKNVEGTGLGLAITKHLIELMGGSISVKSEFGKGSEFTVLLPQKVVSDEKMGNYLSHRHASTGAKENEIIELNIPGVEILVVDDTALNLKVIQKFLEDSKANVTCVLSGEEMLEQIKEKHFDIVFLDHMMPNMDGIEALKIARSMEENKCKDVPFIALTANAIVGAKEMYLDAGFDDYLSKPIKRGKLFEMVKKHLAL